MAEHLNPFLDPENDLIENELEPDPEHIESTADATFEHTERVSIDSVAAKLLKENLILSALELHTELVESGRELPRLRDFFSNPANFERTKPAEVSSPGLPRTSSCQTFDSLDFARYSDDGDRQENEKVAVLEFELRKAQDTIKSLRATLTKTAETELSTPESGEDHTEDFVLEDPQRPYEKRALNFLVNEYLLLNDYKLTSVTFAEENENQDFEDWDDVGLNIPKPPDILHLYRDYGQHVAPLVDTKEVEMMVNLDHELQEKQQQLEQLVEDLSAQVVQLEDQVQMLTSENEIQTDQLRQMEREMEIVKSPKVSTPIVSPIGTPLKVNGEPSTEEDSGDLTNENPPKEEPEEVLADRIKESSPESDNTNGADMNFSEVSSQNVNSLAVEVGSEAPTQDLSTSELEGDRPTRQAEDQHSNFSWQPCCRKMSEAFQKALFSTAFHVAPDSRILTEVSKITDSSGDKVVLMLGRCLPHIVPNVLLAKREELIPLILCTTSLHPDPRQRDQLLNILFNLIKRPDPDQRQMILTGCVAFAQHVGPTRVEGELLPQCWEQISHKFAERRLLVAEACGALAPYLPNEIRSSLVLSMLQQMLDDDKTEEVRESVVKSLGLLMAFIDDSDKYSQGAELLRMSLRDSSERVVQAAQKVFLPAFAMWAMELDRLEFDLIQSFVIKIHDSVKEAQAAQMASGSTTLPLEENKFVSIVRTLEELVPHLFVSVLRAGPYANKADFVEDLHRMDLMSRFPKASSELTDLSVIIGNKEELVRLVLLFDEYIAEEWYEEWDNFTWVVKTLVPKFLEILRGLDVTMIRVVHTLANFFFKLCRTFGRTFVAAKVLPQFQTLLSIPEEQLDTLVSSGQSALTSCAVPVYAAGVLVAFNKEEDRVQLTRFLQDLLCTLSLCHAPLFSLKATFSLLSGHPDYHDLLLAVLWDGVVHTSAQVRATAATMFELLIKGLTDSLTSNRVVPALVTLANDPEISVRIATVPAFGTIMQSVTHREILDKVHMQFQTFFDDPIYQDQHAMHVELIKTFARVGPNAEPKFRDDFVLPRLAIIAATNNHTTNETRRMDIAVQLFEAYSALSCCFISDQLVLECMLPGLRCLHMDMAAIAPDHVDIVVSMIREFEDKVDTPRPMERRSDAMEGGGAPVPHSSEDMKTKMFNKFKDANFKIFGKK